MSMFWQSNGQKHISFEGYFTVAPHQTVVGWLVVLGFTAL